MSIVRPIPERTLEAIVAWFMALDGQDIYNAFLGAFVLAFGLLLLVLGAMAFLRAVR